MRKTSKPMPALLGVGTVSVIFIFMLLSLVTFAVLAYSSATSDYRLSKKAVDRMSVYYDTSNRAQEHIGDLDELLNETYAKVSFESEYLDRAEEEINTVSWSKDVELDSSRDEDGILVSWKEKLDERQHLAVTLRITYPQPGESFYEVEQYRVESSKEWKGDTSIKVYGSDKKQ